MGTLAMAIEAVPLVPLGDGVRADMIEALEKVLAQVRAGEVKAVCAVIVSLDGDFRVMVEGDIKVTHLVGFLAEAQLDLLLRRRRVNQEDAGE
jgi:hypothetical protein